MTKTPHRHADLIKAWADGAEIQGWDINKEWIDIINPAWNLDNYRIKPIELKKKKIYYRRYLANKNFGKTYYIHIINKDTPPPPEILERYANFIRWIDQDWEEYVPD